jgi:gluconate 2-dehydrogenase gamma chain
MPKHTSSSPKSGSKKESKNQGFHNRARKVITRHQARLLEAIAGRIFPTTDTPGAIEAGACAYIEQALKDAYRPLLTQYKRGLRDLDSYAQTKFGRSFLDLNELEQDAILETVEAGQAEGFRDGEEFFELIRSHVLEGVFGEPSYGGNRDMVGWRLVGFPGQQFGYSDPYINRVVDLSPVAFDGPPKKD